MVERRKFQREFVCIAVSGSGLRIEWAQTERERSGPGRLKIIFNQKFNEQWMVGGPWERGQRPGVHVDHTHVLNSCRVGALCGGVVFNLIVSCKWTCVGIHIKEHVTW